MIKDNFEAKRKKMVEEQIVDREIDNPAIIDAMLKIPRHKFVPEKYQDYAYNDGPVPIGEGQTISQPYIVALMTDLLEVKPGEKVLEIGTGSGYQCAVLSEIGCEVYTVEVVKPFAEKSHMLLTSLGYKNIHFKFGDGYEGWEEYSPYDKIIVTAAPESIPHKLTEQLKPDGLMIVPVGKDKQELELISKENGDIKVEKLSRVKFVPMTHEDDFDTN